jgi:hypothetical protein
MNAFEQAYVDERRTQAALVEACIAHGQTASRLRDSADTRFVRVVLDQPREAEGDAGDAHDAAVDRLGLIWDQLSEQLRPADILTDVDACGEISKRDAEAIVEGLLEAGAIDDDDNYYRSGMIDARAVVRMVMAHSQPVEVGRDE